MVGGSRTCSSPIARSSPSAGTERGVAGHAGHRDGPRWSRKPATARWPSPGNGPPGWPGGRTRGRADAPRGRDLIGGTDSGPAPSREALPATGRASFVLEAAGVPAGIRARDRRTTGPPRPRSRPRFVRDGASATSTGSGPGRSSGGYGSGHGDAGLGTRPEPARRAALVGLFEVSRPPEPRGLTARGPYASRRRRASYWAQVHAYQAVSALNTRLTARRNLS
jgi:hypothetical protein